MESFLDIQGVPISAGYFHGRVGELWGSSSSKSNFVPQASKLPQPTQSSNSFLRSHYQFLTMQRNAIAKVLRRGAQLRQPLGAISQTYPNKRTSETANTSARSAQLTHRSFTTSIIYHKGLSPETDNPQPKEPEPTYEAPVAVELSIERYNELSDLYMDSIVEKLEQKQEDREDVDVEYSVKCPCIWKMLEHANMMNRLVS